ncbi:TetR family transcriptional regulator [Rhodothalassium salexigens DSM 2132]|uniref:TetR family transcriptional regulator n=1 Tax=Rhodothalassium salexigens DSM 2132 TaxID=1188247 RepID=A0A4R2PE19_RHOSA|nr:TetR family transcriptional regulator [Rhodothalassium salexigens]MBB4211947.1 AcrR family transcriptional regulator [Rhodothalassium salexigens DSM 2132]MBK1638609.1 hypothetical protein [Rhodothalassium salexigens DSM 2132]TCP33469.1 TetR family transcriptional regulator [Rhodothalassium salexigens DSM 2132]
MDQTSIRERLIDAAFDLVVEEGFEAVDAPAVAGRAGVDVRHFHAGFAGPVDCIVAGLIAANDSAFEAARDFEPEDTVREKLFELVMARLDRLSERREAIARLRWTALRTPLLGAALAWELDRALALMLDQAGAGAGGPAGALRRTGFLTTVYAPVVEAWLKDDSDDLAHTMAELDKRLDRAERMARRLPFNRDAADDMPGPDAGPAAPPDDITADGPADGLGPTPPPAPQAPPA